MIKTASLLSQAISIVPRGAFEALVKKHGTEKGAKGMTSWCHWGSMIFAQVAGANSLREIHGGMACCLGKLRHLGGIEEAPAKSTLAYANEHRTGATTTTRSSPTGARAVCSS